MQEIKKALILEEVSYYEMHLSIINCLLPVKMTHMEIRVLATFMSLKGDIVQYRFGASARKMVREKLNISMGGLSNYMRSLTDSGFLVHIGTKLDILPILLPEDDKQDYRFRLVKTITQTYNGRTDTDTNSNTNISN